MKIKLKTLIIFVLIVGSLYSPAYAGESFDYISAVVTSLSWIKEGGEITDSSPDDADLVTLMTNVRLGMNKIESAKAEIEPFLKSDNEFIRKSSNVFVMLYEQALQLSMQAIEQLKKLGNMSSDEFLKQQGTIAAEVSELSAQRDQLWKEVVHLTALATNALVDPEREIDGKIAYFNITTAEKNAILEHLSNTFGDEIKGGMKAGQKPTTAASAAIWQALTMRGFKTSDEM